MRIAWPCLILLPIILLAGCANDPTPFTGFLDLPTARAADLASPARDFAVTGRMLVVRGGVLLQWAGGGLKQLAGGFRYESPAYSPDSTRIAVTIVGENHSDLVLLDGAGKRLAQLTDNWSKNRVQDSAWARHPSWSPDGRRIAYASDARGLQMSLWLVDSAGGSRRELYPSPVWGGVDEPSWSSDGRSIALTVFEQTASQIYLVSPASGGATRLTLGEEGVYDPAWSPDGQYLAYVARTQGRSDLWIAGHDGANSVRLTDIGMARSPAWSPDGTLLAFFADRGNGFDLHALRVHLASPALVPVSDVKRLTDGQRLDPPSGISWSR